MYELRVEHHGDEPKMSHEEFDACAEDYDSQLHRGLSLSGENKEFFARGRLVHLAHCLKRLSFRPRKLLDYGCGTGDTVPHFLELLGAGSVVGVDASQKSLELARREHAFPKVSYSLPADYVPDGTVDLAFCNGVFHHVPPIERRDVAQYVADSLRPGGVFAFWENNPWNPGTRWIMSRVPFDKTAIMLWPRETRRLLRSVGLTVLSTDFCFVFPRALRMLRPIERCLVRLPLGGQYQVLARK